MMVSVSAGWPSPGLLFSSDGDVLGNQDDSVW